VQQQGILHHRYASQVDSAPTSFFSGRLPPTLDLSFFLALQWSITSYLEILYYIRPVLIIIESIIFTAAIDRTSLALKANIESTWAKVVTLGVSLFSFILGTYLLYEAFSTDPIPTLAAALLGALICAHIGNLGMLNVWST
jgi:predicted membrane-bound dolichyl-phosphate-mannose-protein mannosyltransferase